MHSELKPATIERGSSNVFADLGLPDAVARQTKLRLGMVVNREIEERKLKQAEAARLLGINQPKVWALANYRLDGFSTERLLTFLTALDCDVEIRVKKRGRARRPARVTVLAA